MINVDDVKIWAEFAGNQCVWIKGDDYLDFCIAGDFNVATDVNGDLIDSITPLGEAEFQLKYHRDRLNEETKKFHIYNICEAMQSIYKLLPLSRNNNFSNQTAIISSIPDNGENGKFASYLAHYVSKQACLPFLRPVLSVDKPEMKNLNKEEKITIWESLLGIDNAVSISQYEIEGKEVIIVDDLYQSGVTMQAYAKYLKNLGAARVFGIMCVKSMRNSNNK